MTEGPKPRAHHRGKVTGVDVFCYRASASPVPRIRKNIGAAVLDISPGGARVEISESVASGESVTLELRDSGTGESFRAQGEVRWISSRKAPGGPVLHAGLQFREIYTPMDRRDRFTGGGGSGAASEARYMSRRTAEKRAAGDRFHPDDYVVTCLRQRGLSPGGLKKNVAKEVVDISLSGAQIVASERLETAERVVLTVHFNQFADLLDLPSEVRWCRPDPGTAGANFRVGLQFLPLAEDRKKKIEFFRNWFTSRPRKK